MTLAFACITQCAWVYLMLNKKVLCSQADSQGYSSKTRYWPVGWLVGWLRICWVCKRGVPISIQQKLKNPPGAQLRLIWFCWVV